MSTYVLQRLQRVSRCLQRNPGGIIGCREACGMSLHLSSRSPGVSSGIQEVSLDVVNVNICLAKAPVSLQVSLAESRRYHSMLRTSCYVAGCLQQVSRCVQQNPGGIIGCCKPCGTSVDISSRAPGVSSRIQEVSLDVANLVYVSACLQHVSRCLQRNPGGIIGCSEHQHMSCASSSKSPGVSNGIQEISLDVVNLVVCLWMSPAGLQVSPAESKRYHWM